MACVNANNEFVDILLMHAECHQVAAEAARRYAERFPIQSFEHVRVSTHDVRERNALFWQRCNWKPGGLQCAEDKIASPRMCTINNCESEEIVEAANIAISNLLPTKSRSLYDIAYNRFKKWCAEKNV
ncbi:hypothetical protein NQ317_008801 [Molorchus minor]|uniref:DUF4817 domain-containing protein n=1 Tax=Molorchus minor TaxID=1323400 RepID=A0ABQ9J4T5_9CUCU|nr:hypothetical protein NQ317_008801 [Molorchus minor]